MALTMPVVNESGEDEAFWTFFMSMQARLQQRRIRERQVFAEVERLNMEGRRAERRRKQLMVITARIALRDRCLWAYPRGSSWWETTQPHLSEDDFRGHFRMNRHTFNYVVSVCDCMRHVDTNMRDAIPLEKRVAIGIYRLASSAEDRTVANVFGVSRASVNIIFRELCAVIVRVLESRFVRYPRRHELEEHVRQFVAVTGFPQGVGALDGCHIEVSPPKKQAADYYNYKGWYSVILLEVVDYSYKFIYTKVGTPGKNHDSDVFLKLRLPKVLSSDLFQLGKRTFNGVSVCPVIIADQAFPLQTYVMKPFPQPGPAGSPSQVFNYHLSSARRVVENAFGRLKARFRILLKGTENKLVNVRLIIHACCITCVNSSGIGVIQAGLNACTLLRSTGLSQHAQLAGIHQVVQRFEMF
ncbi:uncharacterized protein LOC144134077 [Amblyomma americanum]